MVMVDISGSFQVVGGICEIQKGLIFLGWWCFDREFIIKTKPKESTHEWDFEALASSFLFPDSILDVLSGTSSHSLVTFPYFRHGSHRSDAKSFDHFIDEKRVSFFLFPHQVVT
jgi:hypothetical protein